MVSVHVPSAPFVNGQVEVVLPSAAAIVPAANCTSCARGALIRNVTIRWSFTSGEMTLAMNGRKVPAARCGAQSRLMCACCARSDTGSASASAACARRRTVEAGMGERLTQNAERRTQNAERRTPNVNAEGASPSAKASAGQVREAPLASERGAFGEPAARRSRTSAGLERTLPSGASPALVVGDDHVDRARRRIAGKILDGDGHRVLAAVAVLATPLGHKRHRGRERPCGAEARLA